MHMQGVELLNTLFVSIFDEQTGMLKSFKKGD